MNTSNKPKILIVDDDPVSLKILNIVLSKEIFYEIHQANDAEEGIRIAHDIRPDIIISDYYMPGKDGFEFCRYVKNDRDLNKTIFILLTSETDMIKKVTGLEEGADDYIEKTISANVLLSKVKAFLRIKGLQNELVEEKEKLNIANQLLNKNFDELIAILLKILDVQIPGASDNAHLAKEIAEYIAANMDIEEEETKIIVFGALLHEIGKTGLPDNVIKKKYKDLSIQEQEIYLQHPLIGSIIISTISGFKEAAYDVYHQYENYNGSGFPEGLMKHEITIGARILRSINFQEELFEANLTTENVIEQIRLSMNKVLDPVVATCLVDYFIKNDNILSHNKEKISIEDLETGMVVAEDIYSSNGSKILPKNVRIEDWMVKIIMEREIVDPVIGGVYVFKN
ncbi:MAG: response regulator [Proteobacteria bacterium]|nr:response regulator [Pseudomonadota bacterium]